MCVCVYTQVHHVCMCVCSLAHLCVKHVHMYTCEHRHIHTLVHLCDGAFVEIRG